MKHLFVVALLTGFSLTLMAQSEKKSDEKALVKTEIKKQHSCTASCKDGKHFFACGEEGHVCGKDCKKADKTGDKGKEHVCTSACSDGKHALACGEKGHVCSKKCAEAK